MQAYYEQETWLWKKILFHLILQLILNMPSMAFAESSVFFASTLNEIKIAEFIMQLHYCCFELLRRNIG